MAETTNIEWADATFNPWIGCDRISPGCDHCYAAVSSAARSTAARVGAPGGTLWDNGHRVRTSESYWQQPLRWDREAAAAGIRKRVFCASLADVFDNTVDPAWRSDLFKLVEATPNLTWMMLTKRIGNVQKLCGGVSAWPNVWLGATVVNQAEADRDIPKLLATPARVRFLSIEPMLGPISLPGFDAKTSWCPICKAIVPDLLSGPHEYTHGMRIESPRFDPAQNCASVYDMINWVIVGGESGHQARAMHPDWVRVLRDQCMGADVPFLFKQWGEWVPRDQAPPEAFSEYLRKNRGWSAVVHSGSGNGCTVWHLGKKAAGRALDGAQHDGYPT